MAKSKNYKIIDPVGVVGFNGVIHKRMDIINSNNVPSANLKAWLRFGQVEEVKETETPKSEGGSAAPSGDASEKKAKK